MALLAQSGLRPAHKTWGSTRAFLRDVKRTDAVLDRVCQAAHRIAMKGSSMRKRQPGPADEEGHSG